MREAKPGYTPCLDSLIQRYDLTTAAVYGKVYRYSTLELGKCIASQGRIAKELGLSRKTVNERLQQLVKDGYIEETSKPGKTKEYIPTGQAGLETTAYDHLAESEPVTPEDNQEEPVTSGYNPIYDLEPEVTTPVTPGYTNKETKKENNSPPKKMEDNKQQQQSVVVPTFSKKVNQLVNFGITKKKAEKIAKLPHATPEYIEAAIAYTNHKAPDNPTGYLINCITENWKLPAKGKKVDVLFDTDYLIERARRAEEKYLGA